MEDDNPKQPHKLLEVWISAMSLSFVLPDATLETLKNKSLLLTSFKML